MNTAGAVTMPNLNRFKMFFGCGNSAFFNALIPVATNKFGSLLGNAIKGANAATTGVGIFNEAEDWRQGKTTGLSATLSAGAMFFGFFASAKNADAVGAFFWSQTFAVARLGNDLSTNKTPPTLDNISHVAKPTLDLAINAIGGTSKWAGVADLFYRAYTVHNNAQKTDPSNLISYYKKLDPDAKILKLQESEWALKLASMAGDMDDIDDIFLVKG
jgi:hypothetical protein